MKSKSACYCSVLPVAKINEHATNIMNKSDEWPATRAINDDIYINT